MAVNTLIKSFITLALGGKYKYRGNLSQYFNPRISRVKITMVIYHGIIVLLHWHLEAKVLIHIYKLGIIPDCLKLDICDSSRHSLFSIGV